MEVYFDNNATTKVYPQAVEAMNDAMLSCYGNPSSLHRKGLEAERIVKSARETVGQELRVPPSDVFFTSCGSESNNIAIIGAAASFRKKGEIITSKVEHSSVLECFKYLESTGFTVHYINVDRKGTVDDGELLSKVNSDTQLVSLMYVNNETGSITPAVRICRDIKRINKNTLFHVDGVQAFCKLDFEKDMADMISVSAHKIGGPKGSGAVYIKKGVKIMPVIHGGGQESGIRSGTHNVPGIAGFAKAVESEAPNKKKSYDHVTELKAAMIKGLTENIGGIVVNSPEGGSPYVLNVSMTGLKSEVLLHYLEDEGVYVSSGSACSSRKPKPSHVLTAMGLDKKRVDSSIRISFCPSNTMEEAEYAIGAFIRIAKQTENIRR